MLNNSTILFVISCFVLAGVLFLLYKAYQKKKKKPTVQIQKPDIFKVLGENETSGSRNEHFVFPERNSPMKEQTINKFKIAEEPKKQEPKVKGPANELEKLKKDYTGEQPNDRGFVFNLENAIISHELLKKRDPKNKKKH